MRALATIALVALAMPASAVIHWPRGEDGRSQRYEDVIYARADKFDQGVPTTEAAIGTNCAQPSSMAAAIVGAWALHEIDPSHDDALSAEGVESIARAATDWLIDNVGLDGNEGDCKTDKNLGQAVMDARIGLAFALHQIGDVNAWDTVVDGETVRQRIETLIDVGTHHNCYRLEGSTAEYQVSDKEWNQNGCWVSDLLVGEAMCNETIWARGIERLDAILDWVITRGSSIEAGNSIHYSMHNLRNTRMIVGVIRDPEVRAKAELLEDLKLQQLALFSMPYQALLPPHPRDGHGPTMDEGKDGSNPFRSADTTRCWYTVIGADGWSPLANVEATNCALYFAVTDYRPSRALRSATFQSTGIHRASALNADNSGSIRIKHPSGWSNNSYAVTQHRLDGLSGIGVGYGSRSSSNDMGLYAHIPASNGAFAVWTHWEAAHEDDEDENGDLTIEDSEEHDFKKGHGWGDFRRWLVPEGNTLISLNRPDPHKSYGTGTEFTCSTPGPTCPVARTYQTSALALERVDEICATCTFDSKNVTNGKGYWAQMGVGGHWLTAIAIGENAVDVSELECDPDDVSPPADCDVPDLEYQYVVIDGVGASIIELHPGSRFADADAAEDYVTDKATDVIWSSSDPLTLTTTTRRDDGTLQKVKLAHGYSSSTPTDEAVGTAWWCSEDNDKPCDEDTDCTGTCDPIAYGNDDAFGEQLFVSPWHTIGESDPGEDLYWSFGDGPGDYVHILMRNPPIIERWTNSNPSTAITDAGSATSETPDACDE